MSLPFFYIETLEPSASALIFNEENSRHIIQVLRMKAGEELKITDGKGNLLIAAITDPNKKKCVVNKLSASFHPAPVKGNSIAVSLIKNANRFEWFLEKATEIGISAIIPLLCARTEKQHFRYERMNGILISAMLQSQQCWLPVLHAPLRLEEMLMKQPDYEKKFIAHCLEDENKKYLLQLAGKSSKQILLIGPEGDFTREEITLAVSKGFVPVSLGETRLRTETAAIVAAVLLQA